MAVKYLYVPIPPGCSDIVYCDVYRMLNGSADTMEHVGRFRGNASTREIVDLLNATRDSSPAAIYSTKKALNIATRACHLLGIDYAEATPEEVANCIAALKDR